MFAEERQQSIIELLASSGRVTVTELSQQFAVTPETIRKDLAGLEEAGLLRRVHGGAVASDRGAAAEPDLGQRTQTHLKEKAAIARTVMGRLPRNVPLSLLLDAGSTTLALARELACAQLPALTVFTNSVPIAACLSENPEITLHLLGGRLRPLTQATVGPNTLAALAGIRPDIAFLGTNAISADFGLSTPDQDEAAVKTAMIANARRVVVLADGTKLDTDNLIRFAALAEIDALISDGTPSGPLADALKEAEVEVVTA